MVKFVEDIYGICINTIQLITISPEKGTRFELSQLVALKSCVFPNQPAEGALRQWMTPPTRHPPSPHESVHLFPFPKAEKWRASIAGSCQQEVVCWTAPITQVTHWHPPSAQDRAHTAHCRQLRSVFYTRTDCAESMLEFQTVSNNKMKDKHFPYQLLKEKKKKRHIFGTCGWVVHWW